MEKLELIKLDKNKMMVNDSIIRLADLVKINDTVIKQLDSLDYKDYNLSISITSKDTEVKHKQLSIGEFEIEKMEIIVKRESYNTNIMVKDVIDSQISNPYVDFQIIIKII